MRTVIQLHPRAPTKPPRDQPCNGCGVCCAGEPCPLGMLASRRMRGRCDALVWSDETGMYRCGLIEQPAQHLPRALQRAAPSLRRIALRSISAGSGCDCDWQTQPPA